MMATSQYERRLRIHLYNTISRVLGLEFAEGIHQAKWTIACDQQNISYIIDCDRVYDKVQVFIKVLTIIITLQQAKELFQLFKMLKLMKKMGHTVKFNTDTVSDLASAVGSPETRYIFYQVDFNLPFRQIKFYVHN